MPERSVPALEHVGSGRPVGLSCLRADARGVVHLTVRGELDIATATCLEKALATAVAPLVVLDLRGLEFIDAGGIRIVLTAHCRAREEGRRLMVVPGPAHVQRHLGMTGADRTLEFVEHPLAAPYPRRALAAVPA